MKKLKPNIPYTNANKFLKMNIQNLLGIMFQKIKDENSVLIKNNVQKVCHVTKFENFSSIIFNKILAHIYLFINVLQDVMLE